MISGLIYLLSEDIYEVEAIKDFNSKKYLVKWKEYIEEKST